MKFSSTLLQTVSPTQTETNGNERAEYLASEQKFELRSVAALRKRRLADSVRWAMRFKTKENVVKTKGI